MSQLFLPVVLGELIAVEPELFLLAPAAGGGGLGALWLLVLVSSGLVNGYPVAVL